MRPTGIDEDLRSDPARQLNNDHIRQQQTADSRKQMTWLPFNKNSLGPLFPRHSFPTKTSQQISQYYHPSPSRQLLICLP